jgi:hypothetical protein
MQKDLLFLDWQAFLVCWCLARRIISIAPDSTFQIPGVPAVIVILGGCAPIFAQMARL